jgi:hypothetical protein
MSRRVPSQISAVVLLAAAVAVSAGLLVLRPDASEVRNAILALNWYLWLLFVAIYPVSVLQSGKVTGTQPMSVSHRSSSPARYWVGFVTMTIFWFVVLALVSGLTWVAWYAGPV